MQWSGDFGEFITEDVKYSYERIADPKNEAPWKDKWKALDHVEIKDKYNGAIVLKEPFAPLFVTTLCDGPGSITSKAATEKAGGRFQTEFPATCGPYIIKNWVPKQRVELTLNPLWSGPKPDFPDVHFLIVEDEKVSELAYEAGDIDITTISEQTFARYQSKPPAGSKLMVAFNNNWSWLGMNAEHPKLQDKRVRQAIQYAIDVESALDAAYSGLAPRARGIVLPGLPGHRETTKFEKPDPDKARQLLQEAGVTGLELELKALPDTDKMTIAQVIQTNLADVGIKVAIVPTDPGPFWNLGLESEGDDWKDLQLYIHEFGDAPDSQPDDAVVRRRAGRRLELGTLEGRGVRQAPLRRSAGERSAKARRDVHPDAGNHGRHGCLCLARLQAGPEDLPRLDGARHPSR